MVFFKHDKPHLDVARELFDYSKKHHDESEAIIKLALLIMHCDENITNSEIELLNRIIDITKFDKDSVIAQRISAARLEILDVLKDQKLTRKFIDNCVAEIKTPVIQHSLIKMAEIIAYSDEDYSIEEDEIIRYLSDAIKEN